jgi:hypothetical protein
MKSKQKETIQHVPQKTPGIKIACQTPYSLLQHEIFSLPFLFELRFNLFHFLSIPHKWVRPTSQIFHLKLSSTIINTRWKMKE